MQSTRPSFKAFPKDLTTNQLSLCLPSSCVSVFVLCPLAAFQVLFVNEGFNTFLGETKNKRLLVVSKQAIHFLAFSLLLCDRQDQEFRHSFSVSQGELFDAWSATTHVNYNYSLKALMKQLSLLTMLRAL